MSAQMAFLNQVTDAAVWDSGASIGQGKQMVYAYDVMFSLVDSTDPATIDIQNGVQCWGYEYVNPKFPGANNEMRDVVLRRDSAVLYTLLNAQGSDGEVLVQVDVADLIAKQDCQSSQTILVLGSQIVTSATAARRLLFDEQANRLVLYCTVQSASTNCHLSGLDVSGGGMVEVASVVLTGETAGFTVMVLRGDKLYGLGLGQEMRVFDFANNFALLKEIVPQPPPVWMADVPSTAFYVMVASAAPFLSFYDSATDAVVSTSDAIGGSKVRIVFDAKKRFFYTVDTAFTVSVFLYDYTEIGTVPVLTSVVLVKDFPNAGVTGVLEEFFLDGEERLVINAQDGTMKFQSLFYSITVEETDAPPTPSPPTPAPPTPFPPTLSPPTPAPPTPVPPTPAPPTPVPPTPWPETNPPQTTAPPTNPPATSTPVELNVTEAKPPPTKAEEVVEDTKTLTKVGIGAGVVASVTGGTSGTGIARGMILARSLVCAESDDDELPFIMHPLGFKVNGSNWAGAIVGNTLICLGMTLLMTLAYKANAYRKRNEPHGNELAAALLRYPSLVVPFVMMFMPSILECAFHLIFNNNRSLSNVPFGVLGVLVNIAFVIIIMRYGRTDHTVVELLRSDESRLTMKRRCLGYFFGLAAWTTREGLQETDPLYVERMGVLFESYEYLPQLRGHYFFIEYAHVAPLSLLAAIPMTKKVPCTLKSTGMALILLIQTCLLIYRRGYLSGFLQHLTVLTMFMGSLSMACGSVTYAVFGTFETHWGNASVIFLMIMIYLTMLRGIYDVILFIVDLHSGYRTSIVGQVREEQSHKSQMALTAFSSPLLGMDTMAPLAEMPSAPSADRMSLLGGPSEIYSGLYSNPQSPQSVLYSGTDLLGKPSFKASEPDNEDGRTPYVLLEMAQDDRIVIEVSQEDESSDMFLI